MDGPGDAWEDAGDRELKSSRPRASRESSELTLHTGEKFERNAMIKPKHKFESKLGYSTDSCGLNRYFFKDEFLKHRLKIMLIIAKY